MNIYYYCSYSGSPVGYILGSLNYIPGETKNYSLSDGNIPQMIRKCFESGTVRKAFGAFPTGSDYSGYFLLIKKLVAQGTEEKESTEYYINIAFVTKDRTEYLGWLRNGETKQEIAEKIRRTIDIDLTNDFGFTVNPQELEKLVKSSFGSLLEGVGKSEKEDICIELASSRTDLDDLKKALRLSDSVKDFYQVSNLERWVCYGKKKVPQERWIVLFFTISVLIIATIAVLIRMQENV